MTQRDRFCKERCCLKIGYRTKEEESIPEGSDSSVLGELENRGSTGSRTSPGQKQTRSSAGTRKVRYWGGENYRVGSTIKGRRLVDRNKNRES